MEIRQFIIHRIDKMAHRDPKYFLRDKALDVTDARVLKFTEVAINVFKANESKPTSIFADFNSDTANYPFSSNCLNFFCKKLKFVEFTKEATKRLCHCMKQQQASTGGYVVFAVIENSDAIKLLVCMLHPQDGLSITANLEFEEVTHLELRHIDKAALITAPVDGAFGAKPLTYAGFRKAMSLYFQEFIGPDAFRNPTKDSAQLIDKVEDYASEHKFEQGRLANVRIALRDYVKQCVKDNVELDLSVIGNIVDPNNPDAFAKYANDNGVSAFIKPDGNVFKRWKLIKHESKDGLSIQFKAEMVGQPGTNHRIELDDTRKTLTIKNVEPELIEKIQSATRLE